MSANLNCFVIEQELSSDPMALRTENASSPCRGVCQDELQGMYVSWQPQYGCIIEKLTKIQFSARSPTSTFMYTETDLSHPPPRRQSTMVTGTYIKQRLPTPHNHKCKQPIQSAPKDVRKWLAVIGTSRHAISQHLVLEWILSFCHLLSLRRLSL